MSERLFAGQAAFSTYQRSTAELIVALLWALTLCLAVSLETATRGTMMAAMIPRIVTTANNSINEKADRLLPERVMWVFLYTGLIWLLLNRLVDSVSCSVERVGR